MRHTLEILRHTQSPQKEVTCNLNVLKEGNTHSSSEKVEFHKYFLFFPQKESVCCCNTLISHKKVTTTQCSTRSHCYFSWALLSSPLIGYLFLIQLVGSESKNLGQPSAAFAWNQAEGTGRRQLEDTYWTQWEKQTSHPVGWQNDANLTLCCYGDAILITVTEWNILCRYNSY